MNSPELFLSNCRSCPLVSECLQNAEHIEKATMMIGEDAMSPEIDEEVAPALHDVLQETADDDVISPEEIASRLRTVAGKIIEDMDIQKKAHERLVNDLTYGCPGPLKMRAERNNIKVTATICMSPRAPEGEVDEIVLVNRAIGEND